MGRGKVEKEEPQGSGGVKKIGVFFALALILTGGFLAVKGSFSEHSAPAASPPEPQAPSLAASSIKMSGVVKKVDLSEPNAPRLIVVGESGLEKAVLLPKETPLVLEGQSIQASDLKEGDVLDLEMEIDSVKQEPFVKRASIIVRASTLSQEEVPDDPDFE